MFHTNLQNKLITEMIVYASFLKLLLIKVGTGADKHFEKSLTKDLKQL